MSGDTLALKTATSVSVKVHPLVLFSILDHFTRRQDASQQRVIGTLLGTEHAGMIEVRNCFAVPHDVRTDAGESLRVRVGKEYHASMLALNARVNPKEKVVGWYATRAPGEAGDISEFTCLMYDVYADECTNPLHLLVDTSLEEPRLAVKAFVNQPLTVAASEVAAFQQVPLTKDIGDVERVALSTMISSSRVGAGAADGAEEGAGDASYRVGSDLAALEESMKRLHGMLATVSDYVDSVVEGETDASPELGRSIADAVAAVPQLAPELFERMFNNSLSDLLMVVYLSQLTRVQVAIAEKLSAPMPEGHFDSPSGDRDGRGGGDQRRGDGRRGGGSSGGDRRGGRGGRPSGSSSAGGARPRGAWGTVRS